MSNDRSHTIASSQNFSPEWAANPSGSSDFISILLGAFSSLCLKFTLTHPGAWAAWIQTRYSITLTYYYHYTAGGVSVPLTRDVLLDSNFNSIQNSLDSKMQNRELNLSHDYSFWIEFWIEPSFIKIESDLNFVHRSTW